MKKASKELLFPLIGTLILWVLSSWPFFAETIYFNGVFQGLRYLHDYTLGLLPIPTIYLSIAILIYCVVKVLLRTNILDKITGIISVVLWLLFMFYFFWGINYKLVPLEQKLNLTLPVLNYDYLKEKVIEQGTAISKLRSELDQPINNYKEIESEVRKYQKALLSSWEWTGSSRMRVRKLPSGSLLHLRTSGIYIPHAFEGHFDGGLYEVQWPFTIAHEMAHGYGFTHESDCNFVAYLTCKESKDPWINYSAELAYWRYLASQLVAMDRDCRYHWDEVVSKNVLTDLQEIRSHINKYKEFFPKYRNVIYDNYLKSHGVKEGLDSYDRMVLLVEAYKNKPR